MKKLLLSCAVCVVALTSMVSKNSADNVETSVTNNKNVAAVSNNSAVNYWIDSLYTAMNLDVIGLNRDVFYTACKGYEYLLSTNALSKQGLLTICDFSQRSDKRRLYVLDLNRAKVVFNTFVSHGRNSGNDYATSFSNSTESLKTCLGFMRTAETYIGEHGLSMKLDGMENGFNDNVRARSIVMHGCEYVCSSRASNGTLMGRSFGCPAVPANEVAKIINVIKGGSCFFNYYPDKYYTSNSKILNADFTWPITQSPQLASIKLPDSLLKIVKQENLYN